MGEGGKDGTEPRFSRPALTPPKLAAELMLSSFCQHFTPGRERFGPSSNFLGEWPGGCRHHQGSLDLCTDLCQQSCWVFSILFCILFFFFPQIFCSATFNKVCLFICLCWSCLLLGLLSGCHERGLHSSCGVRISHCSDFSCESGSRAHELQ